MDSLIELATATAAAPPPNESAGPEEEEEEEEGRLPAVPPFTAGVPPGVRGISCLRFRRIRQDASHET